jgi:hypothetical protein
MAPNEVFANIPTIDSGETLPVCLNKDGRLEFTVSCVLVIKVCNIHLYQVVDEGYSWDGASIPKPARWLMGHPLSKQLRWASLWHDICCEGAQGQAERMLADSLFFTLLSRESLSRKYRISMWLAVRLYALFVWRKR